MLLSINPINPQPRRIQQVVDVLQNDGIIIYPTDTVYGLGCSIFSKKAMKRLYQLKKVNQKKPLTFMRKSNRSTGIYSGNSNSRF